MRLDAALMTPDAASYAALTDIDLANGGRAIEPTGGPGERTSAETKKSPRRLPLIHPVRVDRSGAIVFVCLITEASPDRFRRALQSLLAHLATVHVWALFVVFTPSLGRLTRAYQMMVHDELESPLSDDDVQGLWRLFLRWREGARTEPWWQPLPGVAAAGDALRTRPRYRALFRHWTEVDDAAFEPLRLTTAADAIAAGRGRVGYRTLAHDYEHLVPLAGDVRDDGGRAQPSQADRLTRTLWSVATTRHPRHASTTSVMNSTERRANSASRPG